MLVEPDAVLEVGFVGSILEALIFLQGFSSRRWGLLCHFFPVWWQIGLTVLNLEADAGRQRAATLCLKGSVLIRIRCYYQSGN